LPALRPTCGPTLSVSVDFVAGEIIPRTVPIFSDGFA
jgi:hypothetical protein